MSVADLSTAGQQPTQQHLSDNAPHFHPGTTVVRTPGTRCLTPPQRPPLHLESPEYLAHRLLVEFGKTRTNYNSLVPRIVEVMRIFRDYGPMRCPLPVVSNLDELLNDEALIRIEQRYPNSIDAGFLVLCTERRALRSGGGGKYYFIDTSGRLVGCHKSDLPNYAEKGILQGPVLLKNLIFVFIMRGAFGLDPRCKSSNPQRLLEFYENLVKEGKVSDIQRLVRVWSMEIYPEAPYDNGFPHCTLLWVKRMHVSSHINKWKHSQWQTSQLRAQDIYARPGFPSLSHHHHHHPRQSMHHATPMLPPYLTPNDQTLFVAAATASSENLPSNSYTDYRALKPFHSVERVANINSVREVLCSSPVAITQTKRRRVEQHASENVSSVQSSNVATKSSTIAYDAWPPTNSLLAQSQGIPIRDSLRNQPSSTTIRPATDAPDTLSYKSWLSGVKEGRFKSPVAPDGGLLAWDLASPEVLYGSFAELSCFLQKKDMLDWSVHIVDRLVPPVLNAAIHIISSSLCPVETQKQNIAHSNNDKALRYDILRILYSIEDREKMAAALRILLACLVQQQRLKDYLPSMAGILNADLSSSKLSPSSPLSPAPSPPPSRTGLTDPLLASEDLRFNGRDNYDPPVSSTRSNVSSPEPTFSEILSPGCSAVLHSHDGQSSCTSQDSADTHLPTPFSLSGDDFKPEGLSETWKVGMQEVSLPGTEDHNALGNQCSTQAEPHASQKMTEDYFDVERNKSSHILLEDLLHNQPTRNLEKPHLSDDITQAAKKTSDIFGRSHISKSSTIGAFQKSEGQKNAKDHDVVERLEAVLSNIVTPEGALKTNGNLECTGGSGAIDRSSFSEVNNIQPPLTDAKAHATALSRSSTNAYLSGNQKSLHSSNVSEYMTNSEGRNSNCHSAYQESIFSCHNDSMSKLFLLTPDKVDTICEAASDDQRPTYKYQQNTKKSMLDLSPNVSSKDGDDPLLVTTASFELDTCGSLCPTSASNTCGTKSPPGSPLNLLPFAFSHTTPRDGCVVVEEWKDDGDEEQTVAQESERHIDNVENFYYDTAHLYHLRCAPETQDDEASIVPCGYPQGAM